MCATFISSRSECARSRHQAVPVRAGGEQRLAGDVDVLRGIDVGDASRTWFKERACAVHLHPDEVP